MNIRASILSAAFLVHQVQAQFQMEGESCSVNQKCFYSRWGCVDSGSGPVCKDGCTQDSECLGDSASHDPNDYTCDTNANGGNGQCKGFVCTTNKQCQDRHGGSSTWTCQSNVCTTYAGCECNDDCKDDYYGKIVGGSIAAAVIGVIFVIVSSVPCCCAFDMDKPMCPKIAGGLSIVVGIFCIFIPAIASYGAADGATNDTCDKCTNGCTDEEKDAIKTLLTGLGVFVAYTFAYGFLACIFGPIAAAVGCCAICPCCGPLKTKIEARKAGAPVGQPVAPPAVVGQPAGQGADNKA